MSKLQVSDMLAHAFAAEGVDTLFTLMGDANMYWSAAMAKQPGMQVVHARHEHCAVAMADGYARATGKVGVASTTCGPGFTQIMTALTIAARGNVPLVVFAGDAPIAASWYIQQIDMAPLALATGAHYVARQARRPRARQRARGLPGGARRAQAGGAQRADGPAEAGLAAPHRLHALVRAGADGAAAAARSRDGRPRRRHDRRGREADRASAGRGAIRSGAAPALEALAEQSGALLATSLLGKGLFDGNPFALDIAGAFASDFARERFAEADLVIGVGAGLGHYTTEGGYLYPGARTVQIDINPRGLWQGLRTADLHVRADAKAAAEAIVGAPEGARRVAHRLPQRRHGPADRRATRPTPRNSRSSPTPSIRARRSSSSTRRSPRTGTSWSAAATTSASP